MLDIESGARNSTSSYLVEKSRRNKCVLRCDLNVPMLPELRMDSESPFQTAGAEKRRTSVLIRDFGTVRKSISADLSQRLDTYGSNVAN